MTNASLVRGIGAVCAIVACLNASVAAELDATYGVGGIAVSADRRAGTITYAIDGLTVDPTGQCYFFVTSDFGRDFGFIGGAFGDVISLKPSGADNWTFGVFGTVPGPVVFVGTRIGSALTMDNHLRLVVSAAVANFANVRRWTLSGREDMTFGRPGRMGGVSVELPRVEGSIHSVAQDDRKPLVVATSNEPGTDALARSVTVFRVNETGGELDRTFGGDGKVYFSIPGNIGRDFGNGIALQPDGKVLVTGHSERSDGRVDAFVARLRVDGSLDGTFGDGGIVILPAGDDLAYPRRVLAVPEGHIVVAASIVAPDGSGGRAGIAHLNAAGVMDPALGPFGWSVASLGGADGRIFDMARQPDGKIVLVGYRDIVKPALASLAAIVIRFTASGIPDLSWGPGGLYELPAPPGFAESFGNSVVIDAAARVLISGTVVNVTDASAFVARFLP